jgi:hypothetical protein
LVCAAFVILALAGSTSTTSAQTQAAGDKADAAAKASPELVSALSKEIGATPEQAAGAAGALFNVAKSKLTADQFAQVSKAVPGMSSLLSAAPAASGVAGTTGAISQATGGASGLASAASAFSKLGLSPDMVGKAVPVLTNFVTKSGGADVGKMLAGALK